MVAAQQADFYTQADGTLLLKNVVVGVNVEDDQGFKTGLKETATGLELIIYDGSGGSTTYYIESGKLKNILEIVASINGVFSQTLTDEIIAANFYPKVGQIITFGAADYAVISAKSDTTNGQYNVDFNDLGELTFEGQITVDLEDAALTAELVKLGRHDLTKSERISYLDGVTKVVEIEWSKMDTENKKYIVKCAQLS